jgi:hypothetical protein
MGAWGTAAFDNDDASDWVYELEKNGIEAIDSALTNAMVATDLEMPDDVDAIAAGEVIAAALGRPAPDLREDIVTLAGGLADHVTRDHARRAQEAAERVLASSEVADLWAETDSNAEWRGHVDDLIQRLAS